MFSNNKDNTRTAKFYDNIQVFHFPTEDEDARMDPDHPPKDGFYMKCKILNVLTRQIDNKTSQLMRADGNVFFRHAGVLRHRRGGEIRLKPGAGDLRGNAGQPGGAVSQGAGKG